MFSTACSMFTDRQSIDCVKFPQPQCPLLRQESDRIYVERGKLGKYIGS